MKVGKLVGKIATFYYGLDCGRSGKWIGKLAVGKKTWRRGALNDPKEPLYSSTCIMIGLLNLRRLYLLSAQ